MENISDKTRTRRAILKKLKELNLKFKAPTKRSTAGAQNKNLWRTEEDEELRSLYDQYRTEEGEFNSCCPTLNFHYVLTSNICFQTAYNG